MPFTIRHDLTHEHIRDTYLREDIKRLFPEVTILGLNLTHGGHLSHGHPVNFSGRYFKTAFYGVERETGTIDYDQLRAVALAARPKLIVAGASAYPRILDFARFAAVAEEVGALLLADIAHIAGLVAAGLHPSPVPHAAVVTSTTHKTLRGPRGGLILCREAYAKSIDKNVFPGFQGGPLMHVIAAKAVAFHEALQPEFKAYQTQVLANARMLAAELSGFGLRLISGGTDNHLMLVDLGPLGITGREAETWLDEAGITVNKNSIPYDPQPPAVTSGIRLGTPALTTRGMREGEMQTVARMIFRTLAGRGEAAIAREVRDAVAELTAGFPLYAERLAADD